MKQASRRGVQDGDVSLVRRGITDVATSHSDEPPRHEAEGRGNLLVVGQGRVTAVHPGVPIGHRQLLHVAVGRCRVDEQLRFGSATGVELVMRAVPAQVANPAGVNSHRTEP